MEIIIASVVFVGAASFVVIRLIWYSMQWKRSGSMPKVSIEARAMKVRDKTGIFVKGRMGRYYNHSPGYEVTFEIISNGKKRWFFVPVKHGVVAEDDRGILTTQGIRFVRFEKRKSSYI